FLAVGMGRAQVLQDLSAETTEGTSISINCSHPSVKLYDYIHWYRQLPGRGPTAFGTVLRYTKKLDDVPGEMRVSEDRRSSSLWLSRPRYRDTGMYYCAVGD
ncbi:TVAZ2 protein, partial [Turnix velox]|nr:TVAZ2 protein [Turnix velox]